MTLSKDQFLAWFDEFNTLVFQDELPRVRIDFSNTRRLLGKFYWGSSGGIGIKISLYYDQTEDQYRCTLLHEMCHLYCYRMGWLHEGHGARWKKVAAYASKMTGLDVKRTADVGELEVADRNKAKHDALLRKKSGPWIVLDYKHSGYHFIVKTTKAVLRPWAKALDKNPDIAAYLVDDPFMREFSTSRSVNRGVKFDNGDYGKKVLPVLEKSVKIDSITAFCRAK